MCIYIYLNVFNFSFEIVNVIKMNNSTGKIVILMQFLSVIKISKNFLFLKYFIWSGVKQIGYILVKFNELDILQACLPPLNICVLITSISAV